MTPPHRDDGRDPTAQELFADVLAGQRAPEDPAVLRASADPAFRRRLASLLALQEQIDRVAAAEGAVGAAAPALLDAQIAEMARVKLRGGSRPVHPWRVLLMLAATLLVGVGTYLAWPASKPADYKLGNQGLPARHELQVNADYAAIHWQGEAGRLWFLIRVCTRDGVEIAHSGTLRENRWIPARRNYPDEVLIELWLVPSSGDTNEGQLLTKQVFGRDGTPR